MKKFLQVVLEWKVWASLMFTGCVIIYMIISFLFGNKTMETTAIFSLLIISAVGSFIQFLAFSEHIIKNVRYTIRIIIFIIPFAILLSACAFFFRWFPIEQADAWLLFIGIFLLAFIGITIGFEVHFRIAGKKYDGLLGQYKKQRENIKKADTK